MRKNTQKERGMRSDNDVERFANSRSGLVDATGGRGMRVTSFRIGFVFALVAGALALSPAAPEVSANPAGTGLVISQIYGGGGNTGAPLFNDYIEIFNPTSSDKSLGGLSL